MSREPPWHGHCRLQFINDRGVTRHQGGCRAPFKLLRSYTGADGRCELPLLHTAGGLVGGDQLSIADITLYCLVDFGLLMKLPMTEHPAIKAHHELMSAKFGEIDFPAQ